MWCQRRPWESSLALAPLLLLLQSLRDRSTSQSALAFIFAPLASRVAALVWKRDAFPDKLKEKSKSGSLFCLSGYVHRKFPTVHLSSSCISCFLASGKWFHCTCASGGYQHKCVWCKCIYIYTELCLCVLVWVAIDPNLYSKRWWSYSCSFTSSSYIFLALQKVTLCPLSSRLLLSVTRSKQLGKSEHNRAASASI